MLKNKKAGSAVVVKIIATSLNICSHSHLWLSCHKKIFVYKINIMDELDHQKIIKKIIFKELEPSVLNQEIITRAIYDQGPIGEAGRLFRSMDIQYEKVTVLRLEFLSKFLKN